MILTIDNIKFNGKLDTISSGIPIVVIKLENEEDIKFFGKWARSCDELPKEEHVKDIPFETVTRIGILKNCFCSLGFNEESTNIRWDAHTYEWKDMI